MIRALTMEYAVESSRRGAIARAAWVHSPGTGWIGTLPTVPMRQECKNFESRTYANGETVRKCNLDLAPDAPWRCPDNCPAFEPRMADAGWAYGTLTTPETPPEPPGLDDGSAAAVLDEAEDVLNAVGPEVLAEVRAEQAARRSGWKRLIPRRKSKG